MAINHDLSFRLLSRQWPLAIPNAKTGQTYHLFPNSLKYQRSQDPAEVASLCNQPAIYDFLFRKRLAGQPYEVDHAKGFLGWANQGWEGSEYFVFLLRERGGNPVGCIDLKGNDLQSTEIGYWCSSQVTGLMTNTVGALAQLAQTVGFQRLTATTLVDNLRSQSVLVRNGFSDLGEFDEEGLRTRRFARSLAVA